MNKIITRPLILVLVGLTLFTGCTPKNEPRYVNEPRREWTPSKTPRDNSVDEKPFDGMNLTPMYALLKDDNADLVKKILIPLSRFVLNAKFIEVPTYLTGHMTEMLNVFNRAFERRLEAKDSSDDFRALKQDYVNTLLSGCSRDLTRNCTNYEIFTTDMFTPDIITLLVSDGDKAIDDSLATMGTAENCITNSALCRFQIESRYRLLSFGIRRRNYGLNTDFAFAYMKYARLMGEFLAYSKMHPEADLSYSYISQLHGPIFETLIGAYKPKDLNSPELHNFVENFNPWTYSHSHSDVFQHGTETMFQLGASCCLYEDRSQSDPQIAKSVRNAILLSQDWKKESKESGETFAQMVAYIHEHRPGIFEKLKLAGLATEIGGSTDTDSDPALHPQFYDEYFLAIDRLFHQDLDSNEAGWILQNADPKRTVHRFPLKIQKYMRVVLIYWTIKTSEFMAETLNTNVASDALFEQTQARSQTFNDQWAKVLENIKMLDKLQNSYFVAHPITSTAEAKDFEATDRELKAVTQNINYLAVYTSMLEMSYYIANLNGTRTTQSWGMTFTIAADTTIKNFFDGLEDPWLIFAKDTEKPTRLMILYAFDYLLSFDLLSEYTHPKVDNQKSVAGSQKLTRDKMLSLIFAKLVGADISLQETAFENYENSMKVTNVAKVKDICNFELDRSKFILDQRFSLIDLESYTYVGTGTEGAYGVLAKSFSGLQPIAESLNTNLESRGTLLKVLVDILKDNLKLDDKSPEVQVANDLLKKISNLREKVQARFAQSQDDLKCALHLREIERQRAYRLLDEEREYLGTIWGIIKDLSHDKQSMDAKTFEAKLAQVNIEQFTGSKNIQARFPSKFDHVNNDLSFNYSKYDLLVRMQGRVMSDIFKQPSRREIELYGPKGIENLHKHRGVIVEITDKVYLQDNMILNRTANPLSFSGDDENKDKELFVFQGLKFLNGSGKASDDGYVSWLTQLNNDVTPSKFIDLAENMYVMLPPDPLLYNSATTAKSIITASDLIKSYTDIVASYAMDPWDHHYLPFFGLSGRATKAFLQTLIFDKDGVDTQALYAGLMQNTLLLGQLDPDQRTGAVHEAIDFKENYSSMNSNANSFIFTPSPAIRDSVVKHFGMRTQYRFAQLSTLFETLKKSKEVDATSIDPRLGQEYYYESSQYRKWYQVGQNRIIDDGRDQNLATFRINFASKTSIGQAKTFYEPQTQLASP